MTALKEEVCDAFVIGGGASSVLESGTVLLRPTSPSGYNWWARELPRFCAASGRGSQPRTLAVVNCHMFTRTR